jgi:anti-anti-sigma factor
MTNFESPADTEALSPNPVDLDIDVEQIDGGIAVLRVTGEIDMCTAPELLSQLEETASATQGLVLDLEKVQFLASAGLSILVELARDAPDNGLRWGLVATGRAVLRPLEAVGVLPFIPVYPTVADAVAAMNAG